MPNQQTVATGTRGLSDRVDQVIEQISQTSSIPGLRQMLHLAALQLSGCPSPCRDTMLETLLSAFRPDVHEHIRQLYREAFL